MNWIAIALLVLPWVWLIFLVGYGCGRISAANDPHPWWSFWKRGTPWFVGGPILRALCWMRGHPEFVADKYGLRCECCLWRPGDPLV